MIQVFIEKNRKLLRFYYWVMRVGGWMFLGLALLAVAGHSVALVSRISDWDEFHRYFQFDMPWGMFTNMLPTGLLVLGMSQLIIFLLETDRKGGWILRNADKLLYVYTAILICFYCERAVNEVIVHFNEPHDFPLRLIMLAIFILVKLLVLVGVAEILRRLLPMIDESRTLI